MINKKKDFKVSLYNDGILSYSFIENFFNNQLKCNIFDINFNLYVSATELFFEFNCKLNNYDDIELILEELNYCFTDYNIKKEKNNILLYGILRKTNPLKSKLLDKLELVKNTVFTIFILDKEYNINEIKGIIQKKIKDDIYEIISLYTENNQEYLFHYINKKNDIEEITVSTTDF